jgi:hypothetical protein
MSKGQVIEDQRLGKVTKKATCYPQIGCVNLETLLFYCLTSFKKLSQYKTKTKDIFCGFLNFTNICRNRIRIGENMKI